VQRKRAGCVAGVREVRCAQVQVQVRECKEADAGVRCGVRAKSGGEERTACRFQAVTPDATPTSPPPTATPTPEHVAFHRRRSGVIVDTPLFRSRLPLSPPRYRHHHARQPPFMFTTPIRHAHARHHRHIATSPSSPDCAHVEARQDQGAQRTHASRLLSPPLHIAIAAMLIIDSDARLFSYFQRHYYA